MGDGEIEQETIACLALADHYDRVDGDHTDKGKSLISWNDDAIRLAQMGAEGIARTADKIAGLCRGLPMDDKHLADGYRREHIIYLYSCQLYQLAKKNSKESFMSEDQQVK